MCASPGFIRPHAGSLTPANTSSGQSRRSGQDSPSKLPAELGATGLLTLQLWHILALNGLGRGALAASCLLIRAGYPRFWYHSVLGTLVASSSHRRGRDCHPHFTDGEAEAEYVCVQSLNCVQLFYDPMDCSLPGFSVHGIILARILERVTISSSRGSSRPRDRTRISCGFCISRRVLYHRATWKAH